MNTPRVSRRKFFQLSAGSIGAIGLGSAARGSAAAVGIVALVIDPHDPVASSACVTWAAQELRDALLDHGLTLLQFASLQTSPRPVFCVVAAMAEAPLARAILERAAMRPPRARESLALVPALFEGSPGTLACGADARGLMYALLELADRVRHAEEPLRALTQQKGAAEAPANAIRSVGRLFVSEVEDKPWFNARDFWPPYLSMLAAQRFNRLHLAFGIGYDSLQTVTDAYLLFAYPFFLAVPGYEVRAVNLPAAERDRNLAMLQFISSEAVARGIDFQLGIWTHGYQWADSPRANYTIDGLTPENHAAYCRDALAGLLRACPAISGVTLRTHGESGVREGSYAFWGTVFQGVAQSGRSIEIDLHTKGLDQRMIDAALATGMPVRLSPKYWAEHSGLPYQQAAIRELEMPREHATADSFATLSTGSRSFTRYGYADFLREDRTYGVMYRIWPGTHRFLLAADPLTMAAHARAFGFCGGNGAEFFEPLSFKGRRGSGLPGGRCAYADASLKPRWDWEKYLYTYRLWGRLLYDPDANPRAWRRYLRRRFQARAPALEAALACATRILPLITTAHLPSAANDTYFPECYTNQPIADLTAPHPYGDTPAPRVFGNVSPLDPRLFFGINDFIADAHEQRRSGKYSPLEVARWLEDLAGAATRLLAKAASPGDIPRDAEYRRIVADVRIQAGIGYFFAAKLRSAALYALHARSGQRAALAGSLQEYRRAREIWSQFAQHAGAAYVADVTVGPLPHQRGHWLDRLPAMDADIAVMARELDAVRDEAADTAPSDAAPADAAMRAVLADASRLAPSCVHVPPAHFVPNEPLRVELSFSGALPATARLYYRHVNQAEDYQVTALERHGGELRATIPPGYTASRYPLQYFFELQSPAHRPQLYPGFDSYRSNQPYFVVRAAASDPRHG